MAAAVPEVAAEEAVDAAEAVEAVEAVEAIPEVAAGPFVEDEIADFCRDGELAVPPVVSDMAVSDNDGPDSSSYRSSDDDDL
jgi:hypothetical protein